MIGSSLLTLYRSFTRHKLYALLNIGGLALGIAVFLVLLLFVRFERSFDQALPGHDKLYMVTTTWHVPGVPETPSMTSMGGLIEQMRADFPQVTGTRFWSDNAAVLRGASATAEDMAYVDSNYFDFFPYPALAGDPRAALRDPNALVLTRELARRYFGGNPAAAIGAPMVLVIDGERRAYKVGAVIADAPKNMTLAAGIYAPLTPARTTRENAPFFYHWGSQQLFTIVRFEHPGDAAMLARKMPDFVKRRGTADQGPGVEKLLTLDFLPLAEVHLRNPADQAVIATLGIVGLLTLIIAIVNYVNLATARAGLRAREVAVRKVLGGTHGALMRQFLIEAVATVAISGLIGLALAEIALPFVNAMGGTALSITYLGQGSILPGFALLVIGVGLLAGIYPGLVLARFRPAAVLASARAPGGGKAGARLRQALVVLQFAIAIAFTIATGVLIAQTSHLRAADLGFQRGGILVVPSFMDGALDRAQRSALLADFARIPGVTGVTFADTAPGSESTINSNTMNRPGHDRNAPSLLTVDVGPDFFRVYGAHLRAGRLFDRAHRLDDMAEASDKALSETAYNVVLNARAVRELGFASPEDAVGKIVLDSNRPRRVIGVVDDMRFHSPRDPVRAALYNFVSDGRRWPPVAAIRFADSDAKLVIDRAEAAWKRVAPAVPFSAKTADRNLYDRYYQEDAQRSRLFTIGAVLAVLIGCIGLYGLASFDTSRRVKEIGIRKALGASTRDILRLLIAQFLRPVVLANLIAWPLAFFAMRHWLAGFDDRVALSPAYFLAATAIALAIAGVTIIGQAWRVARAEPARALRYE